VFFEGTEKKFEMEVDDRGPSLRALGDDFWSGVARASGAWIVSSIRNGHCDAHLLSESSLFVFDHKVVMITCGRTRLTEAVDAILDRVGTEAVEFFVYERKNEVFPHNQPTSFFDDAERIHRRLPGRAFKFGEGDDHHLYLFHLDRPFLGPAGPEDVTVELLMYGIDDEIRSAFSGPDPDRVTAGRVLDDLDAILPGFEVDDHRFEPSGYSVNALRGPHYWTVHVTPELQCSYVSFETNVPFDERELEAVARAVVAAFRSRSFDLVVFDSSRDLDVMFDGYRLKSHVGQELDCGYRVRFKSYYRPRSGIEAPLELPLDGSSA